MAPIEVMMVDRQCHSASRSSSVVMADGVAVERLLCCNKVHYRCPFSYTYEACCDDACCGCPLTLVVDTTLFVLPMHVWTDTTHTTRARLTVVFVARCGL